MRALIALSLFGLACAPSTTVITGDDDNNNNGDTSDTGNDTGSDTGADTDSGSDTDTGGDTGSDENPDAGDYSGTLTGTLGSDEWAQTCEGDLEFTVDQDGVFTGTGTCAFEGGGWGDWAIEGDMSGEVVKGEVTGVWTVDMGWGEPYEAEVTGEISKGRATLEVYADLGRMGEFVGEGDARSK